MPVHAAAVPASSAGHLPALMVPVNAQTRVGAGRAKPMGPCSLDGVRDPEKAGTPARSTSACHERAPHRGPHRPAQCHDREVRPSFPHRLPANGQATADGPLTRCVTGNGGFVLPSSHLTELTEADLGALVARTVEHYRALGLPFEWKARTLAKVGRHRERAAPL